MDIMDLSTDGFIQVISWTRFIPFRESYNVTQEATSKKSLPRPIKTIHLKYYIISAYKAIYACFHIKI